MAIQSKITEEFAGFSKLKYHQRLTKLKELGFLNSAQVQYFQSGQTPSPELAEHFIENVLGYFPIPLGVGVHLNIDNKNYALPMAVEETSIIASISKTAKWLKQCGSITTKTIGSPHIIGQIQIAKVQDVKRLQQTLAQHRRSFIDQANQSIAQGLVRRGGGIKDIQLRILPRPDHQIMGVIHVLADTCDAMGANIITQICEYLKPKIEHYCQEHVSMCILSNLNDTRLTQATITIDDINPELATRIADASLFAELDPYRAATHNKGILNGIDPVLIATGNDWRAVEAAIHAYACKDGQYRAVSQWRYHNQCLTGILTIPVMVGIVGGMTQLHPTAKLCLEMLGVPSAEMLARIVTAAGLVQNLGALKALTTVGLVQGHMKLHISNLSLSAGATDQEIPLLQKKLEELLSFRKRITLSNAIELLKEIRHPNLGTTTPQEQTV